MTTSESFLATRGPPTAFYALVPRRFMGAFGDAKRAESARRDLPGLVGSEALIGLVLLDEDQRELPVIHGHVVRMGHDSLVFRRYGADEEIPLGMISKRIQGDQVVQYGERRPG
jgi:hypothetical protein